MKDFSAEIRAHLDVEHFLSQAQLMLDLPETNAEQILDRMLHHLLDSEENPAAFQEASKVLFTHKSGQLTHFSLYLFIPLYVCFLVAHRHSELDDVL